MLTSHPVMVTIVTATVLSFSQGFSSVYYNLHTHIKKKKKERKENPFCPIGVLGKFSFHHLLSSLGWLDAVSLEPHAHEQHSVFTRFKSIQVNRVPKALCWTWHIKTVYVNRAVPANSQDTNPLRLSHTVAFSARERKTVIPVLAL